MKNIAYFIEFSSKKNYNFFIDIINPIITEYLSSRERNDFSESVRNLGKLTEALLKELHATHFKSEEDPSFSTLLFDLKNCDHLNVRLSPPIETILRFIINLRNISSHKTNDNLRDFIMLENEIKIEECIVSEIIKVIKWYLANKGFDISKIPNYTYVIDQKTLTDTLSIPKIYKDIVSFQSTLIPENAELHIHSMIIDFLIRGMSLVDISNKYFNNSDDEGKISYKILFGIIGLNTKWQQFFKNNNYKDIINLLDSKEHGKIIEALRIYDKKSN